MDKQAQNGIRQVEIFTDGACKGNPGPGGWGVCLQFNGETREFFGGEPETTNNRMELLAAIRALQELESIQDDAQSSLQVQLHTDSQYVQKGMSEWMHGWKKRGWRTADKKPVKNEALWKELDELAQRYQVKWFWVRGHDGHAGNERADWLANQGVETVLSNKQG